MTDTPQHHDPDLETTAQIMCARHPGTPTKLACSECDTPICPRCAVETPVGQKCPSCARPARAARRQGKPRQYVKAAGFGMVAAVGLGVALALFVRDVGFFSLIASGFAGYGVGAAVDLGAEGNRQAPFRRLAIGLAVLMVLGVWTIGFGHPLRPARGLLILSYLAAPYGALLRYR